MLQVQCVALFARWSQNKGLHQFEPELYNTTKRIVMSMERDK